MGSKMRCALSSKVVIPIESSGRSLEINILMASRQRLFLVCCFSPDDGIGIVIDPEISKQITEFSFLPSGLGYPSADPFKNKVK